MVVIGPGLAPGYLLVRDMVAVPDPSVNGRLLGLGHEAPRVVPSDLVVALAAHVVPGDLVQKVVLVGILVGAAVGAARLAPGGSIAGSAAALAAVWNPFVAERLAMGQWALLVGYAALPWVVRGAARAAAGGLGGATLALGLVVGSLGGAAAWLLVVSGLLGATAGMAVARRGDRWRVVRRMGRWVALALLLAVPWAVPGLLRPNATTSDATGFEVFAPRADTPGGVALSLLTGGGIWNADVVTPGRDSLVGLVGALAVLVWGCAGYVLTRRTAAREIDAVAATYRPALAGAGAVGLTVALVSAVPAVLAPAAGLPGGGLLRDGSREIALWVVVVAVGTGWGVAWLQRVGMPRLLAVLSALLPVAALPALGWGVAGILEPIDYPDEVLAAVRAVDSGDHRGAVVVLPFETYRRYPWNGARPSLTPWPRLLQERTVVSSDLVVSQPGHLTRVAGEDAYAAAVRAALEAPDPARALRDLGVGWFVTDVRGTPAPVGSTAVLRGVDTVVYRTAQEGAVGAARAFDPPVVPVLAGDLLWLVGVAVTLVLTVRRAPHREASPGPAGIG